MTQRYFPFDSGNGSDVTEAQWSKMAQHWLATGVLKGLLNELHVYADSTGMRVKVKSGQAWVKAQFYESDAEEILTISAASALNPRIDRVILRLDWNTNTVLLAVLQGTPAASPAPPALTQSATRWEISLAQVLVGKSVATIAADKITDERTFVGVAMLSNHFVCRGITWGGIGSAGALNQVPLIGPTIGGIVANGFHVGNPANSSVLVCDVPGRYLINIKAWISGLNAQATADAIIRHTKSSDGTYGDEVMGVYGFSGAGGNYNPPNGIEFECSRICDLNVNDFLTFLVRCSEAPRNINGYFISVQQL